MANMGNAVTAMLKLDSTGFNKGINSAVSAIDRLQSKTKSTNSFSKLATGLEKFRKELTKLESATRVSDKALNQLSENITRVGNALTVVKKFETEVNIFKKMTSAISQLKTSMQGLANISRGQLYNALYGLNTVLFRVEYHLERLSSLANGAKAFNTFATGLTKMQNSLSGFASRTGAVETGVQKMILAFQQVKIAMSIFSNISKEVTVFNKFANGVHKISEALVRFKVATSSAATSFSTLGNAIAKYQNQLTQLQAKQEQVSSATTKVANSVKQINTTMELTSTSTNMFSSSLSKLSASANSTSTNLSTVGTKISATANSLTGLNNKVTSTKSSMSGLQTNASNTSNSISKVGSNASTASNSFNTLSNSIGKSSQTAKAADGRYKTLSNTLFSLRGITSMVGAMFAFQLVQGFIDSTQQSIHAKSQMEAYQKTMGMSEHAVDSFNKKLNETVSTYKKMNKYSLGETVAGLGIEFNLTGKQMEGMMKTVARLQSEYLRAGRSAEEADLAVKDIMQGEFLRLSRETGVGKTDLQALGWSGDTKDIESLQRALDKVAEQRNWDAFAQQATSLSDVLAILKNRFGEFVADLTSIITPGIVGAFNLISSAFGAVENWYNNSSFFTQGMTQFLGVASALAVLTTGLIAFKGHMGLAEIASAGFGRSLLGVALGFDKTTIASTSAMTMLKAWIAGTNTAIGKELSFGQAIASRILGLNRASVATNGVVSSLIGMSRGMKVAKDGTLLANSALKIYQSGTIAFKEAETALNGILQANGVQFKLTSSMISAYAAQMDVAKMSSLSFVQKLAMLNPNISATQASTMKTSQALKAFAGSSAAAGLAVTGVLIVALIALAAAFATIYDKCQQAKQAVEGFQDVVENGDDYIKDAKNREKYWTGVANSAKQHKATATNARDSADAEKYLAHATNMAKSANIDYQASLKAVQQARSYDAQHKAQEMKIQGENTQFLQEQYKKLGLSEDEAAYKANNLARQVEEGNRVINESLQKQALYLDQHNQSISTHIDRLREMGADTKATTKYLDEQSAEVYKVSEAWKAFNQGDMMAGFKAMVGEFKIWWNDLSSYFTEGISLDDSFKMMGQDLSKSITGFVGWIQESFENTDWQGVGNAIAMGLTNIDWIGILGGIGEAVLTVRNGLLSALWGIIEGLGQQAWTYITNWFNDSIVQPLSEAWNSFMNDPLGTIGGAISGGLSWLLDAFLNNGTVDALTTIWEWLNTSIIQPLQEAWGQFTSDPLSYLMSGVEFGIGMLLDALLGNGDTDALTSIWNWLNNSIILPLQQAWSQFASDPLGYLAGVVIDIGQFLNSLFGDVWTGITNWVNNSIIQPISQAIQTGLANIPILGSILQMLGLVDGANQTASDKGKTLGDKIGEALKQAIYSIPVVGDILRILDMINGTYGTANSKGKGVGRNIKDGEKSGHQGTSGNVASEMLDVVNAVAKAAGQAYSAAVKVGQSIWNGINSILQRHSPGFIHDQVKAEFQNDLPSAILGATTKVYDNAALVGQAMVDGVTPSVDTLQTQVSDALSQTYDIPQLDPAVAQMLQVQGMDSSANQDALAQYQSDAQYAEQLNYDTSMNTMNTFSTLGTVVDGVFNGMGTSMVTAYTGMNTNQQTLLNGMTTKNQQAYTQMQTQTTTSLNNMRNSTQNVTNQMTNAWGHMKDNIVASANQLKTQSTSHFNQLSGTIGRFYRKLQNPSSWGAGDPDSTPRYTNRGRYNRGVKAVNRVFGKTSGSAGSPSLTSSFGKHGAGTPPTGLPESMKLNDLLKMMCPNGSCIGTNQKVNVNEFLSSFLNGAFGTWRDWSPKHFSKIKNTTNEWDAKSPRIMGWIDTNTNFKVKRFLNGQPNVSFDEFKRMAEALFSAIQYDFYMDSSKCGNWVAALQTGAVNCYDGTNALLALARTCGFSGSMAHGSWNGVPHVWAVINGQKMDTTGWQKRRTWTPSASAGSPSGNMDIGNTTNNSISVSVRIEGDVYGVDDLDSKIQSGVKKGMAEAMNTSNIIGV